MNGIIGPNKQSALMVIKFTIGVFLLIELAVRNNTPFLLIVIFATFELFFLLSSLFNFDVIDKPGDINILALIITIIFTLIDLTISSYIIDYMAAINITLSINNIIKILSLIIISIGSIGNYFITYYLTFRLIRYR